MSFLKGLDVCASGMTAQWMRMDIISENITNVNTTRTEGGDAYRRKMVVLEPQKETKSFKKYLSEEKLRHEDATNGVKVAEIVEDERPFRRVYDPTNPDADEEGYVNMPNVDILKETIDAMSASRAYEASLTAFNVFKSMAAKALEIGK